MERGTFGYEDLEVWQKAIDWATEIVSLCNELETDRRHFLLVEQLEAACSSIAMTIAEGKGRYSQKESVQFLYVARGSLYETAALLQLFLRQDMDSRGQVPGAERERQGTGQDAKLSHQVHQELPTEIHQP
ncbi:MAG: four helix bundle protein [Chloroflexi bacterium]|nr:four helix bundle protein [Chloroflexota bacterium]